VKKVVSLCLLTLFMLSLAGCSSSEPTVPAEGAEQSEIEAYEEMVANESSGMSE
jgi:hypothetical protein